MREKTRGYRTGMQVDMGMTGDSEAGTGRKKWKPGKMEEYIAAFGATRRSFPPQRRTKSGKVTIDFAKCSQDQTTIMESSERPRKVE